MFNLSGAPLSWLWGKGLAHIYPYVPISTPGRLAEMIFGRPHVQVCFFDRPSVHQIVLNLESKLAKVGV